MRQSTNILLVSLATLLAHVPSINIARADIFQWEYINPANPAQGKQPSATLCPDGVGVIAGPAADFDELNLTKAYLINKNLTGASAWDSNLSNADMSKANLMYADFSYATLSGANITGADVRGAYFYRDYDGGSGLTPAQLYSTASYQAHDLSEIDLFGSNLTGASFVGQNLTDANFGFGSPAGTPYTINSAILAGVDFSHANLTNVPFYECDLTGANFSHANLTDTDFYTARMNRANLAGQDLTNLDFSYVALAGANLSGAEVKGASFDRDYIEFPYRATVGGLTPAQIYTTASYQARDLSGVSFYGNQLAGANFAGQKLTDTTFDSADLDGADFTGADTRGAYGLELSSVVSKNLIGPDGHIAGLDLTTGASLLVRHYDGGIGITVDEHLSAGVGGVLQMEFEDSDWGSLISFARGIPVTLGGGTLSLDFAPGVDVSTQVGRTIDLFDWTGVSPTGTFTVTSPYSWDLSGLYTSGQVTLTAVPEPGVDALLGIGIGFTLFRRSRRAYRA